MNYKKDLKLAFPKSLWYQLSTSNTFSSRCKLHNKPTWNKRINISNWQIFKVKLKVNLFAEFHSTYVNVWLTKKKKGFLYSCGILFLKNDSRKGGEILYRRFPPKKKKKEVIFKEYNKTRKEKVLQQPETLLFTPSWKQWTSCRQASGKHVGHNAKKTSQLHKINTIFYTWMKNCLQGERSVLG